MPKAPPPRPITEQGEANLRQRIQHEREARGWSYEALAKAMTKAGCPISKAAVYAIEHGNPPRRILVNELLALAKVFDEDSIDGMVRPLPSVLSEQAQALIDRAVKAQDDLLAGTEGLIAASAAYLALREVKNEMIEFKVNQLESMGWPVPPTPLLRPDLWRGSESAERLRAAYLELYSAVLAYAMEQVVDRG